ncbi:hypothetical protein GCM10027037_13100 [Mucilaginibacter koreensis]
MSKQSSWIAFGGGLAGALALTALHQYVKANNEDAPRMDLLGMEALGKSLKKADAPIPEQPDLYYLTMAGDIVSNALFYSAAGLGKKQTWLKGALLGLAAGAGAVYLPKPMGLNEEHSNRTPQTQAMAVLYYLTGGLVAAGSIKLLNKISRNHKKKVLA